MYSCISYVIIYIYIYLSLANKKIPLPPIPRASPWTRSALVLCEDPPVPLVALSVHRPSSTPRHKKKLVGEEGISSSIVQKKTRFVQLIFNIMQPNPVLIGRFLVITNASSGSMELLFAAGISPCFMGKQSQTSLKISRPHYSSPYRCLTKLAMCIYIHTYYIYISPSMYKTLRYGSYTK
jgi:hypothetical protein